MVTKRTMSIGNKAMSYIFSILLSLVMFFALGVNVCLANSSAAAQSFFSGKASYEFPQITIDPSNVNDFSTPIAWYNSSIYIVNVEPPDGANNKLNLKTVVRKGTVKANGTWTWENKVIENRTLDDPYHTQPSIAVDKHGYIHVVYNMHNMPWQYKVSKKPEDISEFEFKGEALSTDQLKEVKIKNEVNFPYIETAAIPGTQITYPAFFKDRNGELFITYRFATKPKQSWENRGFAGGIAKYDADRKKWEAIGGNLRVTSADVLYPSTATEKSYVVKPFAYQDKWSVYYIRLCFDKNNIMHLSWTWREGGAGPDCSRPTYAVANEAKTIFKKANGSVYRLPVDVAESDRIDANLGINKVYASTSLAVDTSRQPYVVVNSISNSVRILAHYDLTKKKWLKLENTPWSSTAIFIDDQGKQWAFSTGINIFSRNGSSSSWSHVLSADAVDGYIAPKIIYVKELGGFFIHAMSKDIKKCKIIWFKAHAALEKPKSLRLTR